MKITGEISLYGNPIPNVQWYIGDKILRNVSARFIYETKIRYQRHMFGLKADNDMCGRKVSYHAIRPLDKDIKTQPRNITGFTTLISASCK